MSSARVAVEWVFGEITEYLAFVNFKKNQKIALSEVGTMYKMCVLLRNAGCACMVLQQAHMLA